jgi:hypothetical protein
MIADLKLKKKIAVSEGTPWHLAENKISSRSPNDKST